ncbi:hypothetical protein GCM10009727_82570 [Actinomadura napierensis]|uniref:Uncharacterized protein n=1 Tax=Actinomadura napierensis TaxID=267854 RepID=A0ABN3AF13_9ACTN
MPHAPVPVSDPRRSSAGGFVPDKVAWFGVRENPGTVHHFRTGGGPVTRRAMPGAS